MENYIVSVKPKGICKFTQPQMLCAMNMSAGDSGESAKLKFDMLLTRVNNSEMVLCNLSRVSLMIEHLTVSLSSFFTLPYQLSNTCLCLHLQFLSFANCPSLPLGRNYILFFFHFLLVLLLLDLENSSTGVISIS